MFNLDDYETVEERLIKYWKDNPNGRVFTRLLDSSATRFIVEAYVYRESQDAHPWATGLAEETIQGRGVNATSALENCETSAIGRALANAGYATKGKRASREEMNKVKAKADVETMVAQTKAQLQQSSGTYVPVPSASDPWTIVPTKQGQTLGEAVEVLTSSLGAEPIKPAMLQCKCGTDMIWATGTMKNGKPWGHYKCKNVPSRKCQEPIWYNLKDGAWVIQR